MRFTSCLLIVILIVSCQKKSEKKFEKLEKLSWLLGNWENQMPNGILVENWKRENDSTYNGESFFINKKDTIHYEYIQLIQNKEEVVYNAIVEGQNNEQAIPFILTSETNNTFIFENLKHDYPQKIVYKKINTNHLIATISGTQQGKFSSENYSMTKK
jgi:hypothetical protein